MSVILPKTACYIDSQFPNQILRSANSTTMTPAISRKPQLQITIPNEDLEKTDIGTVKMVEAKCEVMLIK